MLFFLNFFQWWSTTGHSWHALILPVQSDLRGLVTPTGSWVVSLYKLPYFQQRVGENTSWTRFLGFPKPIPQTRFLGKSQHLVVPLPWFLVSTLRPKFPPWCPARFDNPDLCWLQWPASHSCWRHCTWDWDTGVLFLRTFVLHCGRAKRAVALELSAGGEK